ncbi:hypothetical protein [Marinitenerispora sediminis]|uniref:Uncharacterized protein n=1 Tax=Marinitenerispora sediminis TaxID=1931232 RepID=A0A368T265_9ACTN|nr:hypothetical protein [Marinitenerispora sediminis]RCV55009.1 hypothetical protein DEF24_18530 [Marinitenerispora sediminis]RCV56282.1 hypothetical protein DEF28_03990 [Marinitenerispora sediminis]RCV61214.1 hypothetical protein DEF23_02905 [Marinitenerispora sediminis]
MLRSDLVAPRKQRHTVKRIFARLVDEHQAHDVSYGIVRRSVVDRRPQIRVEAGRGPVEVFISQTHRPGAEAEGDFGDVTARLNGEQVTCSLFSLRLSYSGKAVSRPRRDGRPCPRSGVGDGAVQVRMPVARLITVSKARSGRMPRSRIRGLAPKPTA